MKRFGLELHPDKTRLIPFQRPPYRSGGGNDTESWDFLGFTYYWSRSRRGNWIVKPKTIASRLNRALKAVGELCRRNRHLPVRDQHTHPVDEAARTLRVLRDHRKLACTPAVSSGDGKALA
jgi:hypothetical protein